jgi:hypothetical protein
VITSAFLLRRKVWLSEPALGRLCRRRHAVGFIWGRPTVQAAPSPGCSSPWASPWPGPPPPRHPAAEVVPDLEIQDAGLVDNQTGAGLIPWPAITEIRLDQRRNRGAGNALLLLRLAEPDRITDRLRLGYRIASIGMWPGPATTTGSTSPTSTASRQRWSPRSRRRIRRP